MHGRDCDMNAWGFAETAFTPYGIDAILDRHVLPQLKDDNYYQAFSKYFSKAEEYLKMAKEGKPFGEDNDNEYAGAKLIAKLSATILLPLLIASAICMIWRGKMKTAKIARTADNYIPENGFNLTKHSDTYLYRTVTRRKIEKNTSSSSSSGGSSRGGGSTSHSRKF
jgi:uncharacterized protein